MTKIEEEWRAPIERSDEDIENKFKGQLSNNE